jgi:DNA helicase HerA-like ATPase
MLLLLGVPACGLALSSFLRRAGLHWSWALLALPLALRLGPLAPACAIAALHAARRHRAAVAAGGDLATAALAARRPLDVLRGAVASRGPLVARGRLAVGREAAGALVRVPLGRDSGTHTLVVGATGAGKTVTQAWLIEHAIALGHGAVVIDPKGDALLRATTARAAREAGRRHLEWTPQGSAAYNPFAHGSDSEIADKALAAEPYSEPHYLRQAQRYLGHAVRALRAAGRPVEPQSLLAAMDPRALELIARELPDEQQARAVFAYLDELDGRARAGLAGTRDRLAILAESDFGAALSGPRGGEAIDLLACVRERAVVYFRLDADRVPLLARMLAAAIVQDLLTVAAECQAAQPVPTLIAIDEFSAIAPDAVARLFGRARAAGFSLLLATQELADLREGELLDQVLGNLTTLIAHRQVVPASAELIAAVAGTRPVWVTSQQLRGSRPSGRATRSRGREYAIHPDAVRSLERGCAAVIEPSRASARLARIFAPQEVIADASR